MDTGKPSELTGDEKPNGFLVVGIGASAGGIPALQAFFREVTPDSGMAYVVILHLSPDHDSKLAEVLQVAAGMPVTQVKENTRIEPDHVYVVPPNQHLVMNDGFIAPSVNLRMEERRAPVDIFFRSLAETYGPRAVCVVLSGTGANGSMGLKRVKEKGGVAFVQSPREAEYNEMPRNSIATDLVDEILPVAEIPAAILTYRNSLGTVQIIEEAEKRPEPQQQALREIFTQLRVRTGHDFSNYKRPTLLRRIERRINIRNLPDLPSYTDFLHDHPDETHVLLKDLLISVTNFFRDAKAFEVLEREVLPAVFSRKGPDAQVRIWVAGCATGEEAYSVAMLCAERTMGVLDAPKVQVFATDIDESAIATAREGYYTLNDAADVSPDRLRRFFHREGDGYRVRRELREMILFAHHNFLKDPPFSRLDLVTCRNVLIYLNATAQERVIETFHFALNPRRFLFLGTSESVDGASDLYATFNRDHHIFQAREVSPRNYPVPESVPSFHFNKADPLQKTEDKEFRSQRISFGDLHQKLLEQYAPPSVVVNEEYEIVHMTERVRRYLEFTAGEPTQNLLKLIKPEIRLELRSALYQAAQHKTMVEAQNVRLTVNGQVQSLDIQVRPVMEDGDPAKGFILVVFKQNEEVTDGGTMLLSSDEPVARQLEEELIRIKAQLRNSVEQHEFQAEELKASNEELQAMNEELRSAAEELETSKEELQSINEELRTVNQELKVKIDETSLVSNNLQNLINSSNVGTIFLDRSFGIRLFTPTVLEIFNLKSADYGRPLTDITHKLKYDSLLADAEAVLEKLTMIEREVTTTDNRFYMMRILPYRTSEDRINGVVITFFDVTGWKESEEALRLTEEKYRTQLEQDVEARTAELGQSQKQYATLVENTPDIITRWNRGLRLLFANTTLGAKVGMNIESLLGHTFSEMGAPEEITVPYMNSLRKAFETGEMVENFKIFPTPGGESLYLYSRITPEKNAAGETETVLAIARDITELQKANEEVLQLKDELARQATDKYLQLFNSIDEGFCIIEVLFDAEGRPYDYRFLEANKAFEKQAMLTNAVGKTVKTLLPDMEQYWFDIYGKVATTGEPERFENFAKSMGFYYEVYAFPTGVPGENQVAILFNNITERKLAEERQAFLLELSDAIRTLDNPIAVQQTAMRILGTHLQVNRAFYAEALPEDNDILIVGPGYAIGVMPLEGQLKLSDFDTDLLNRYLSGQATVLNDIPNGAAFSVRSKAAFAAIDVQSAAGVALLKSGKLVGILSVHQSVPRTWRKEEVKLLEEVAERTWAAVQRARVETAMQQSEAQLRAMAENLPGGAVFIVNKDLRYLLAEGEALTGSGATPADYIGRTIYEVVPEEELKRYEENYRRALEGNPFEHEHRMGEKTFVSRGAPLSNSKGEVYAVLAISYDITERKQIEEALRRTGERLQLALEAGKLGSYEYDFGTGEITATTRHKTNYGFDASDDFSFEELKERILLEDRQRMEAELAKAIDGHGVYAIEYRVGYKGGAVHWVRSVGRVIHDDKNVPQKMVGITKDITPEKAFTEALTRMVEERTRELQRSNNDLQQFASMASHDLQEPLRKLKLFTSVLQKFAVELPEEGKELLSKIHITAERMSQLIREVLQFSRIAYGIKEFAPVDLDKVLRTVLADLEILLTETNTTIIYENSLPQLEAIPLQMNQVFYNLLTNAVKFRREGVAPVISITLNSLTEKAVKAHPELKEGLDYIEIIVADNGIGFEQQYAEQIFQIFERLHSVEEFEGTGVGLALCKKIVENHSGHINAVSNPGAGTAFHILLPLTQ